MPEFATKADVLAIRSDLLATEQRLRTEFRAGITELQTELRTSVTELRTSNETLALRLTVRFGAMAVVAIGALATILTILKSV